MLPAILPTSLLVLYLTIKVAEAENQPCQEIPTETHFKMEDVEGTWYPTDIVLHRDDLKISGVPLTTNCPVVTFSVPNRNKKAMMMLWNSTEGELEYKFIQRSGVRGQWQSAGDQQGGKFSILSLNKDKYMILRYCSPTTHNSYFLSRQTGGSQLFLSEAKNVLGQVVKYPQVDRQTLCSGVAGLPSTNILTSSLATEEYKSFGGLIRLIKLDDNYAFLTFCSKYNRILSTVAFSRTEETPRDVYDETLEILEKLDQKRAQEIPRTCGENEADSAQHMTVSVFLIVFPAVVSLIGL